MGKVQQQHLMSMLISWRRITLEIAVITKLLMRPIIMSSSGSRKRYVHQQLPIPLEEPFIPVFLKIMLAMSHILVEGGLQWAYQVRL